MKRKTAILIIILEILFHCTIAHALKFRTLRAAIPGKAKQFIPGRIQTYSERCITINAFETLVRIEDNKKLTNLASEWKNEEYKKWVCKIKPDIKFHDNSKLKPEHVIASLASIDQRLYFNWPFKNIESIKVTEKDAIEISLASADSNFIRYLALPQAGIWKTNAYRSLPLGTGPFVLEELISDRISLIAFKEYRKKKPSLNRVEFIFISSNRSMVELFRKSQVHICPLSVEEYLNCSSKIPKNAEIIKKPTGNIVILRMNYEHPLFSRQSVYRGIYAALGRRSFDVLLAGQLEEKVGWYPFSTETVPLRQSMNRAKQYLKSSRIPPSMTIRHVSIFGSENLIFNKIASHLEEAGFQRIKVQSIPETDIASGTEDNYFEFSGEIIYADLDLPYYYINCTALKHPHKDIKYSYIPLYSPIVNILYRKGLQNFKIHPNGVMDFRKTYWKDKKR